MRQGWIFFVCGVLGVFAAGSLLHVRSASGEGSVSTETVKPAVPLTPQFDAALARKKLELEEAERRLKESETRLAAEEQRLRIRIQELTELESRVEQHKADLTKVEDANFSKLVKSLETMQAKKAASVIASMDDALAISVMRKMKEKKIATVMDAMEPSRAVALSTLFAERKPASAEGSQKGKEVKN